MLFFHITANFFKRKVLPRSPLTMLSIRDLTLHSGPKTTLKGGGAGGGVLPKYKRNVQILLIEKNCLNSFVQDCGSNGSRGLSWIVGLLKGS